MRPTRMEQPRLATPQEKSWMDDVSCLPVRRRSLPSPYAAMCCAGAGGGCGAGGGRRAAVKGGGAGGGAAQCRRLVAAAGARARRPARRAPGTPAQCRRRRPPAHHRVPPLQLGDLVLDRLPARLCRARGLGGEVGVAARAVPVAGDGLGVKGDLAGGGGGGGGACTVHGGVGPARGGAQAGRCWMAPQPCAPRHAAAAGRRHQSLASPSLAHHPPAPCRALHITAHLHVVQLRQAALAARPRTTHSPTPGPPSAPPRCTAPLGGT